MQLSLGFSPCPNDCFIFDALVHQKIDTEGLDFKVQLDDVETLNQQAMRGMLDVTKLSFYAYAQAMDRYILLRSGSALGFNCGPILISKKPVTNAAEEIKTVAIPGKLTTANFLLSLALPLLTEKKEYLFSDIERAVLEGEVDAGLIIHENRFTYEQNGLLKVMDLGEYWDSLLHTPIPLGGIVIKRSLDNALQQKVNGLIKKSVAFAFANPQGTMDYVTAHAQEMSPEVIMKHIGLYVNDFSIELGHTGIQAIEHLFDKAKELNLLSFPDQKLIID